MFNDICAKINWSPVTNISTNVNSMDPVDDKKLLLKEIIECRRLGHLEISLKLAKYGLTYYPNDPLLFDNIARVYWKLNRYSDAVDLWKKVLATKESPFRLKKSALNFILNDHVAFTDFIMDNVSVSKPMGPVLKKFVDLSIEKRKLKESHSSYEYIEHAWLDSFMHPALVDNFARFQFAIGSKFKSLYCFKCLAENASNDNFKELAENFLEQNESEYLSQLSQDIQKICIEFDQSSNNFKTIDSVIDFVTFRLEIGSEVLAQNKDSLFNIALFRYIESNDIIICSAYEMFFDACLNLSYITEAQNFYDKYNHYFTDTSQAQAKEKLNRLKSVFFPSYVGALNHQLIELANSEEINFEVLDITDAETYSDLEKTSVELLKKFTLVNPSLTLKIFDCFVNVGFLTPHMFKYRGMAFLTLGLQKDGVMAFQEYISFIEGSIDLIDLTDLSVSNKKEVDLIVTSDLKNKIYDHIENLEYSSAATFLADFILRRSFFSALNNPELRYLIFDHKKFIDNTIDPVKKNLKDLYADLNFYDSFLKTAQDLAAKVNQ